MQFNIVSACQIIRAVDRQLIGLAQLYQGGIEMLDGCADIPVSVCIVEPCPEVETVPVDFRLRQGGIVRFLRIKFGAVELLEEHTCLNTCREHSPKKMMTEGILGTDTLVGENAQLVVEDGDAGPMVLPQKVKRHVCPDIECVRVMLVAGKVETIGTHDIQLVVLAHRCRIE